MTAVGGRGPAGLEEHLSREGWRASWHRPACGEGLVMPKVFAAEVPTVGDGYGGAVAGGVVAGVHGVVTVGQAQLLRASR
jgi:hypothetical protein